MLALRALIFELAEQTPNCSPVEESLKWGQPSYRVAKGTPLRLGVASSGATAVFAHCQTQVIPEFRAVFPNDFTYDGNRAVHLSPGPLPLALLRLLIKAALTYRA